jgi:hypothetical protein
MTTETDIETLQAAANAAATAVYQLERERDQKAGQAAQAVRNTYGPKLRELEDAKAAASLAVHKARVAATIDHPWEGQIVTREEQQYGRYGGKLLGTKTVRGFVRTYRPGVELPQNRSNYVKIGDVLVFALKKDGTPGKDYDFFKRHEADWKLAGVA